MNRRASDRFPITDRMTWAVLRWVDAMQGVVVRAACVCAIGTFWLLLGVVIAAGVRS